MSKRKKTEVMWWLFGAAAVGGVIWYLRSRTAPPVTAPPVTAPRGSNFHPVTVDDNGQPSPGPAWYLDTGLDGKKTWLPIGGMS